MSSSDAATQIDVVAGSAADVIALVPTPVAKAADAAERTVEVDVDRLRFDLSPRRRTYDPDHVTALADVFPRLPPILVHGPTMHVIDGVHRVLAARSLGKRTTRAVVFDGSFEDASILAVRCNIAHGKPLDRRERQAAAAKLLGAHPEWSDRRIAAVCGVSPKTVGRLRLRATETPPRLRGRVGRDGKTRPTDPVDLRRRVAEALEADPAASIRQIAARTGAAQGTVRDVRARVAAARDAEPADVVGARPTVSTDHDAYRVNEESREFTEWFNAHVVRADADWLHFVPVVPVGRVYEVADAARQCAESWRRLAAAMEARADRRRRSKGA